MIRLLIGLLSASLYAQMLPTPAVTWPHNGGATTFAMTRYTTSGGISCTTNPCSSTVTMGPSNLVVFTAGYTAASQLTLSSITGGGTWVVPSGCATWDSSSSYGTLVGYNLSSTAGSNQSITVNLSGTPTQAYQFFSEWQASKTPAFDACGTPATDSACTTCTGLAITITGTQDALVQIGISPTRRVTAQTGYTAFTALPASASIPANAGMTNATTAPAPSFTLSASGRLVLSAIAFK